MKYLSSALLALAISAAAQAQMQPGFKDFDVASGIASSSPKYLQPFNGKLYFYGSDGNIGREPYVLDAASGKATLIKNMNTLSAHAISLGYNRPNIGFNGKYYFTATDGGTGEELFVWDGTNAPTLVADLTIDADSSRPDNFVVYNNKLYFTATVDNYGTEIYMYDGTNPPTRITDINAGPTSSASGPMVLYNNKLYFVGTSPTHGAELWQLDPANNTPAMVADIDTGASSSAPANLTVLNGKIYFSANSFWHGRELYSYDGSAVKRLTDISFNSLSSLNIAQSNPFAWFSNKLFFSARDTSGQYHVWSNDGTNTQLEFKINPVGESGPRDFVVYNNRLFFTANDGANGIELFAYDGTNAPALIGDLCTGTNSSQPQELTVIGDELYFSANNCNNSGVDLFSYNYKRVGLRNVLFDAEVEIFPNPVVKDLNIHMTLKRDERLRVRLANIAGKNIYDTELQAYNTGKNKIQIPMTNLPGGNYIYYISNAEGTTYLTGKVVK